MKIYYVSTSTSKFEEAATVCDSTIELVHIQKECPEIQVPDVVSVAEFSSSYMAKIMGLPVIADDMGLYITALNGFPGAYVKYVAETIGSIGVLRLMEGVEDRSAFFRVGVSYCEPGGECITEAAERHGMMGNHVVEGPSDFGLNTIFVPDGSAKYLSEYNKKEKRINEPRIIAVRRLLERLRGVE